MLINLYFKNNLNFIFNRKIIINMCSELRMDDKLLLDMSEVEVDTEYNNLKY
jgi:hypothetical protein